MSQARSEIAGNVIFLSTILLLPVRETKNEADWTSETQASERKLENSLPNADPCLAKTGIRLSFFSLDEKGLKFRPSDLIKITPRREALFVDSSELTCSLNIPHLELSLAAFPSHMLWRSWRCKGSFFPRLSIVTSRFQSNIPKVEVTTPF